MKIRIADRTEKFVFVLKRICREGWLCGWIAFDTLNILNIMVGLLFQLTLTVSADSSIYIIPKGRVHYTLVLGMFG